MNTNKDKKYALLVVPPPNRAEFFESCLLGTDLKFERRPLTSLVSSTADIDHWSGWLGSIQWDESKRSDFNVLTWCDTETPEDNNHENVKLKERLFDCYHGLTLSWPLRLDTFKPILITGRASLNADGLSIVDIKTVDFLHTWVPASFSMKDEYFKWLYEGPYKNELLSRWSRAAAALENLRVVEPYPLIVSLAVHSFRRGLEDGLLDFRVPDFIRAAETILAIPKGGGKEVFARRAIPFLDKVSSHPFPLSGSAKEDLLRSLFQLRSDSVHGKPFAWELRNSVSESEFFLYEYLAETLAREVVGYAIASPSILAVGGDRDKLEELWLKQSA